jgi:hypothetical protein
MFHSSHVESYEMSLFLFNYISLYVEILITLNTHKKNTTVDLQHIQTVRLHMPAALSVVLKGMKVPYISKTISWCHRF